MNYNFSKEILLVIYNIIPDISLNNLNKFIINFSNFFYNKKYFIKKFKNYN